MSKHAPRGSDPSALPYRPCVGVMLVNRRGLVFVGRRLRSSGPEHVDATHSWQMPQGGIDPGEDPFRAALRELYEETNVGSVERLAEVDDWLSYDLPAAILNHVWRGKYRGQRQKWFALRFTGEDSEIDIQTPGGGRHKPEFDAWRWEKLDALADLVVPFKKPVYDLAVAALGPAVRAIAAPT